MALPFFNKQQKARTQIVAIDLGARSTKVVQVQRRGESYVLSQFAILDAPIFEKTINVEILGEHLKAINTAMGRSVKNISFVVGVQDCVFRPAEVPNVPVEEMRQMLKVGSKNFLQQDLPDHIFDCCLTQSSMQALADAAAAAAEPAANPEDKEKPAEKKAAAPKGVQKAKILAAGAKRQFLEDLQSAAKLAGMVVEQVVPAVTGPPNALEFAQPEAFKNEIIGVVDIGFKNSTISILIGGELKLNRVVAFGGDRLSAGLAEAMSIPYNEAEGIKVGLASEVEGVMQSLLMPLGQELRASLNFFENQHDKVVSKLFLSGGSAKSDFIVQSLQSELGVVCERWNPTGFMTVELPGQQAAEIEQVSTQLTVAIGAALAAL